MKTYRIFLGLLVICLSLVGCASSPFPQLPPSQGDAQFSSKYRIGAGDSVEIFVWRYPDVSTTAIVRPDGFLTTPLLEDFPAAERTPTELARDLEKALATYLRDPLVTVIVNGFVGVFEDQIRVVGEAAEPQALLYKDSMTLLDLMIQVGGLTDFADGNKTIIVRMEDGELMQYNVRVDDLIRNGDISANVDMKPGDIMIIPEAWF
ncbi:MAG: sugar ABC transporter substrate-binding protein [Gammaproteobacteria bacterium]|nr:sugar ABC transporter substrate-binding protein [Gammaproteobacteria bacterium]